MGGNPLVEPFTDLFKLYGAVIVNKSDFMEDDDDGVNTIVFCDDGEDVPFYYAIDMKKRNKVAGDVPAVWLRAIRAQALSYSYDVRTGILYVSNTLGAAYGFPPTAKHLQLAGLDLAIEDWDDDVPPPMDKKKVFTQKPTSNDDWMELVENFISEPNRATYQSLVNSDSAKRAYEEMSKLSEFRLGSNKKAQSGELRKMMLGPDRCKTYEDYAEMVKEYTLPKGTAFYLINLYKLRGLVRNTADGKVFFERC